MPKEKNTIKAMLEIYCQAHHRKAQGLCVQCADLNEYAVKKSDNCVFGKDKPACSKCKIHCYSEDKRNMIIKVMRFSGPRMIGRHPLLALKHILKTLKKLK